MQKQGYGWSISILGGDVSKMANELNCGIVDNNNGHLPT